MPRKLMKRFRWPHKSVAYFRVCLLGLIVPAWGEGEKSTALEIPIRDDFQKKRG